MSIQQVRYDVPQAEYGALGAFADLLTGATKGFIDSTLEEKKNLVSLLPVLAQMKMVKPGGKKGDPGTITVGGQTFSITSPGLDYEDENSKLLAKQRAQELGLEPKSEIVLKQEADEYAMKHPSVIQKQQIADAMYGTEEYAAALADVEAVKRQKTEEYFNQAKANQEKYFGVKAEDATKVTKETGTETPRSAIISKKEYDELDDPESVDAETLPDGRVKITRKPADANEFKYGYMKSPKKLPKASLPPAATTGQKVGRVLGALGENVLGREAWLGKRAYESVPRGIAGLMNAYTGIQETMGGQSSAPVPWQYLDPLQARTFPGHPMANNPTFMGMPTGVNPFQFGNLPGAGPMGLPSVGNLPGLPGANR